MTKANRAVLMRHASQWNPLSDVQVSAKQALMTLAAMDNPVRCFMACLSMT